MAALPKIATCLPTDDLTTTPQLQGAYLRASDPKLRETATRPLFEELFNEYLRSPSLSVFGEQQLDDSQQRVDVAVGFHDRQPSPNLVFVLLAETKRHTMNDRYALEPQLEEYADRYLGQQYGGLAIHHTVFGATAYGTTIRFFRFSRETGNFESMTYSGKLRVHEEAAYWDVKTDGRQILGVLKDIWDL